MEIPEEVVMILLMLVTLGVILGIAVCLAFECGSSRMLDYLLGYFRWA